jgi:predicted phosphoribosyltransferase
MMWSVWKLHHLSGPWGAHFRDFRQVDDEEVIRILGKTTAGRGQRPI